MQVDGYPQFVFLLSGEKGLFGRRRDNRPYNTESVSGSYSNFSDVEERHGATIRFIECTRIFTTRNEFA